MTEPDLGWLLAQIEGKEKPLSESAARAVVRRWDKLKLAKATKLLMNVPRLVTATTAGAVLVGQARIGADGRPVPLEVPAWTQMNHVAACARVRLALQAELGEELMTWKSDRVLRAESVALMGRFSARSGVSAAHQPDAVMVMADESEVAVEVELSVKAPGRLVEILDELGSDLRWSRVRYFASPEAARAVKAALEKVRPGNNPITVEPLPELGHTGESGKSVGG